MAQLMRKGRPIPNYHAASGCKHPGPLRHLLNDEWACDACVHVARDRHGLLRRYDAPASSLVYSSDEDVDPEGPEEDTPILKGTVREEVEP